MQTVLWPSTRVLEGQSWPCRRPHENIGAGTGGEVQTRWVAAAVRQRCPARSATGQDWRRGAKLQVIRNNERRKGGKKVRPLIEWGWTATKDLFGTRLGGQA